MNRTTLTRVLLVLRSGLPWEMLRPRGELLLHQVLLELLQAAGQIDWRRAGLDSASVPPNGGSATGFELD